MLLHGNPQRLFCCEQPLKAASPRLQSGDACPGPN